MHTLSKSNQTVTLNLSYSQHNPFQNACSCWSQFQIVQAAQSLTDRGGPQTAVPPQAGSHSSRQQLQFEPTIQQQCQSDNTHSPTGMAPDSSTSTSKLPFSPTATSVNSHLCSVKVTTRDHSSNNTHLQAWPQTAAPPQAGSHSLPTLTYHTLLQSQPTVPKYNCSVKVNILTRRCGPRQCIKEQ